MLGRRGNSNRVPALKPMRYIALAEATSFLALLVASAIKRTGGGETGVEILGPLHGALFVAYVVVALNLRAQLGWSGRATFWVLAGAVLPFGGYVVDWWLLREARRTEAEERAAAR